MLRKQLTERRPAHRFRQHGACRWATAPPAALRGAGSRDLLAPVTEERRVSRGAVPTGPLLTRRRSARLPGEPPQPPGAPALPR